MTQVSCPHCGELTDTFPDAGEADEQRYIEDCAVCCRPILFVATYDEKLGDFDVSANADV